MHEAIAIRRPVQVHLGRATSSLKPFLLFVKGLGRTPKVVHRKGSRNMAPIKPLD